MNRISNSKGKGSHTPCPICGGPNFSGRALSVAHVNCPDCGYSNTAFSSESFGQPNNQDFFSSLITLGLAMFGAYLIGNLLSSLDTPRQKESLPKYDEEYWQKFFR